MAEHDHSDLRPGDECPTCHRKVPAKRSDAQVGGRRDRVTITVPRGEEGTLEGLMIAVAEKYESTWPADAAAARNDNIYILPVGERSWQYRVLCFSLIATLQVPGLEPTE